MFSMLSHWRAKPPASPLRSPTHCLTAPRALSAFARAGSIWFAVCVLGTGCEPGDASEARDSGVQDGDTGVDANSACSVDAAVNPCGPDLQCIEGRCRTGICGDGVRTGAEECDDGNQFAGDGCTPSCKQVPLTCGDGKLQEGEECDDGNWFDLDACSDACTKNICGNGREDGIEECDDNNRIDGDQCSNACKENRCRNGRLDEGEECDDGNRVNDDTCSNSCVSLVCGNERTEGTDVGGKEECDDGNRVDDDACSNACAANICGNRRLDPGEVCDGNGVDFACSEDCKEKLPNTGCNACLEEHCRSYEALGGYDVVKPCLDGGSNDGWGEDDPEYAELCTAVVSCARMSGCAYDPDGLNVCFCGTADVSSGQCAVAGKADGPCMSQIYAAGYTTDLATLLGSIQLVELPVGAALYMTQCERDFCTEECAP